MIGNSQKSDREYYKPRDPKPAIKPFNSTMNDRVSPVRKIQINGSASLINKRVPMISSSKSPVRMSVRENKNESIN